MLPGDARGGGGHRRIDVDLERRQTLAAHQIGQEVDDFLGAADGEGGHDQVAVGVARALEGRNDFVLGFRKGAVQAVAVGRFDEQHVGFGHDLLGVVQHRAAGHAEVAGKNQFARPAFAADRHLQPGGTEDVAGVMEADRDGFSRVDRLPIGRRTQQLERRLGLGHGVKRRLQGRPAAAAAPPLMAQSPL
jgi:hypothetical protein